MPFTLTRIPLHLLFLPVLTIKSNPTSRFSSKLISPGHQTKYVLLWNPLFFSHSVMSKSLQAHELQHGRLLFRSLSPGACSNSYPLSQWCYPIISSSVAPFSSCPQSFPASGSFPMSQFFASGGQTIGVSASTSVLPMNIQGRFPLGWTGLISLPSKGLSRIFSVPQFESLSSSVLCFLFGLSHPYITIGKTIALTRWTFVGSLCFLMCCLGWS